MSDKKRQVSAKPKPEHVIRCGEVVLTIWKRRANSGLLYRTFLITREWRSMTTQRDSHATSFFESNEKELIEGIRKAAAYVRDKTNCNQSTGSQQQDELDRAETGGGDITPTPDNSPPMPSGHSAGRLSKIVD